MHVEPVTFTRVFDVSRCSLRNSPPWTTFGFTSQSGKMFGARVNCHPPLPEGTPLLVVMKRQGDWKAILGWADVTKRLLAIEDGGKGVILLGWFSAIGLAIVSPLFMALLSEAHRLLNLLIAITFALIVANILSLFVHRRNLVLAKRALEKALREHYAQPHP